MYELHLCFTANFENLTELKMSFVLASIVFHCICMNFSTNSCWQQSKPYLHFSQTPTQLSRWTLSFLQERRNDDEVLVIVVMSINSLKTPVSIDYCVLEKWKPSSTVYNVRIVFSYSIRPNASWHNILDGFVVMVNPISKALPLFVCFVDVLTRTMDRYGRVFHSK